MARHKKPTLTPTIRPKDLLNRDPDRQARIERHAAYAALIARLTAFQVEISAQAKSRPAVDAPAPTVAMAADLIAQIAALMGNCPEAQGLPRLDGRAAASFSQTAIAIAQSCSAFEAFGKRLRYDRCVVTAITAARKERDLEDYIRRAAPGT